MPEDALTLPRWVFILLIGVITTILSQTIAVTWWARGIEAKIELRADKIETNIEAIKVLNASSAIALQVARDHGGQFDNFDTRLISLVTTVESMRATMEARTVDRFKRADWATEKEALNEIRAQDRRLADERHARLDVRINLLEQWERQLNRLGSKTHTNFQLQPLVHTPNEP